MGGAAAGAGEAPGPRHARRVATTGVSASRNLRSFATAFFFVALTVLAASAAALLIAEGFYGYAGLR